VVVFLIVLTVVNAFRPKPNVRVLIFTSCKNNPN